MTELLLARCRFLALAAATFAVFGVCAELLEIAEPYPERPFVNLEHR